MATSTGQVPRLKIIQALLAAVSGGADAETPVAVAPFAGTIQSVSFVANAALNGANTNSRTLQVINHLQDGAGSTVAASKAFTTGINAPAFDETPITLSGTPANLDVAVGDVLSFKSLHIGTGIADPGGLVVIKILSA